MSSEIKTALQYLLDYQRKIAEAQIRITFSSGLICSARLLFDNAEAAAKFYDSFLAKYHEQYPGTTVETYHNEEPR